MLLVCGEQKKEKEKTGVTRMAGVNNAINTLSIGPISHVSLALPLHVAKPPLRPLHINDHVIIWMLMAVIAQLICMFSLLLLPVSSSTSTASLLSLRSCLPL